MATDQRIRQSLLAAGVDPDVLRDAEAAAADAAGEDAERVAAALGGGPDDPPVTVYSDMDRTHSAADYPEHAVRYVDLFTHAQDVRGWVRFDTWGVPVEGARVLSDDVVELELGPTVHDRVRFAREREALR